VKKIDLVGDVFFPLFFSGVHHVVVAVEYGDTRHCQRESRRKAI
jgi:hypothetical protein